MIDSEYPTIHMMRPNIFLAAFNKSGSIHIQLSLLRMMGTYRNAQVVFTNTNYAWEEQRIDSNCAYVLFNHNGQVFNHHVKASPHNLELLQHYKVRPVVIMRNVLDCLVSLRDKYDKQDVDSYGFMPTKDGWFSWDDERKFTWLIYNAVPYYCTFYISWVLADIPKHFVWYEEHHKDQVKSFRDIFHHTEIDKIGYISDEDILAHCSHRDGNFCTGISGRGRQQIPDYLVDVAYEIADSYGSEWKSLIVENLLERAP